MTRRSWIAAWLLALPACSPADSPAPTAERGVVLQPAQGERLLFRAPPMPDLVTIKVGPENSDSKRMAMGTQDLPAGYVVPVHKHLREDEILFIHKGHGVATLGDEQVPVEPGTTIYIPRGTWHGIENPTAEDAQMVWVVVPPGLEEFFREASQPPGTPWVPLTPAEVDAIGLQHGVVFKPEHPGVEP